MAAAAILNLARIPAGEFMMGAPDAEGDERPVHRVYLDDFFIGRFAVTNDEYARFVRETGHPDPAVRELPLLVSPSQEAAFREISAPYEWDAGVPRAGRGHHPVVLVGVGDAMEYCRWLSEQAGRRVRLPTEAEWEKAARGGGDGQRYPWGDGIDASRGNFLPDTVRKKEHGTRATGTYPPNGYGLYDMAGNVWEWVSDWYAPDYYSAADVKNPAGPVNGTLRLIRGGSWVCLDVSQLRCAHRHKVPPDTYSYSIGFRIACST